jgi:choline-glycine betaine transporter
MKHWGLEQWVMYATKAAQFVITACFNDTSQDFEGAIGPYLDSQQSYYPHSFSVEVRLSSGLTSAIS